MGTRANIRIYDDHQELWFYRHHDGNPDSVLPSLTKFLDWIVDGKIENNVVQAWGWLIVLGHREYNSFGKATPDYPWLNKKLPSKVGHYEPTIGIHSDVDYVYHIDLPGKRISVSMDGISMDLLQK